MLILFKLGRLESFMTRVSGELKVLETERGGKFLGLGWV